MKKIIIVLFLLIWCTIQSQTVAYTSSTENFANPERGWHKYSKSDSTTAFSFLSQSSLTTMRINDKMTLLLRIYDLGAFKTTPISQEFLNNIQTDFNTLRASGVKCILRFRYSGDNNIDAVKSILLGHIEQLKTVTLINQDVITAVEAGFIGKYGEWYYTSNYGDSGVLSAQNIADRKEIGLKIMELAPSRLVLFRTPAFQQLVGGTSPVNSTNAYNGSVISRTGLHNDAFLSSSSDVGTFTNTTTDYTYLDAQSKYTFCGGESNGLYPTKQDCSVVFGWLTRFHYTYLNYGYYPDVINLWKTQGCYDEIQRRLGYRFELVESNLLDGILSIKLKNVGFANIYNAREVLLILKNQTNATEYIYPINTDIRFWNAGATTTIVQDVKYNIPNGKYDSYIWIPDNINSYTQKLTSSRSINPDFAIRFANLNVWEATKGYNNLLQTVTINNLSVQIFFTNNVVSVSGTSKYTLKVYDLQGRLVSTSFDLSNLKIGYYIIKVKSDGILYFKKIYKS